MAAKKKAKRKITAKSKKVAPSEKKSSLEDLQNFTTGKIDDETLKKVADLEEVLGIKTTNPFGTNEPELFEKSMAESTVSDLQHLCTKVGVFPDSSRARMKQKLREEFKRVTRGSRSISMETPISVSDPNHPNHERAKKLMGEGF
jgi:hypothetical protein